jgi:hypothetical protein
MNTDEQVRREIVYVKFGDRWCRFTVISRHNDLGGTMTIANRVGTATCRQSEAIPEAAHLRSIFLEKQAEARDKYAKLIEFWNKGITQPIALAELLATTRLGVYSMVAAAKRWELIDYYPTQTYEQRSTDQSNLG